MYYFILFGLLDFYMNENWSCFADFIAEFRLKVRLVLKISVLYSKYLPNQFIILWL